MIVLDTNILSEFIGKTPERAVVDWLDAQNVSTLHVTSITLAEIHFGIELLPSGQRRSVIEAGFDRVRLELLQTSLLPFDERAAVQCGRIRAARRTSSRPMALLDAQIAAIASVRIFASVST